MSRSAIAKDEFLVSAVSIERSILLLRGQRVILGGDLAVFYDVEPRVLSQAVKRNSDRFPADFMFVLSEDEWQNLKSQNVISSWGGARSAPMAFTEQGVAMLSSVLNSEQAIQVNVTIMRAFVRIREILSSHKDLALKLVALEQMHATHDAQIKAIFDAIRALMEPPKKARPRIGF